MEVVCVMGGGGGGGGGVKWLREVMKVICVGVSQRICAGCELFYLLGRDFESVQFFLLIFEQEHFSEN